MNFGNLVVIFLAVLAVISMSWVLPDASIAVQVGSGVLLAVVIFGLSVFIRSGRR